MNAITDPYRMLATAITSISSWKVTLASGKSGSTMRRNPYAATFDSTPESTATTGVGAAV